MQATGNLMQDTHKRVVTCIQHSVSYILEKSKVSGLGRSMDNQMLNRVNSYIKARKERTEAFAIK